ncbi:MAG: family 1 glycosylhydrolase [Flavisolibacter sp.]
MEKQSTDIQTAYCNPEIWGGIECTINRVHNDFHDQLDYSGHYYREGDLEHLADLGIKQMRYPILWEKHEPVENAEIDWSWTSRQLDILRSRDVGVIAGLVHHGSGPSFTSLDDVLFPEKLAAYARKVAEQFPWIDKYTPVNEPLTTARFSGLYGFWYPHQKNGRSFARMLLNELKGTVLAMQEIRKINPSAQLVQTEDLGKTYSSPKLNYQARFENERRWLTFDILSGRFDRGHFLWQHFMDLKIPEKDLVFFQENPCLPDVFGFNHYLTSERYLDENLSLYPVQTHGNNGRHSYADVEAVRVPLDEETGLEVLLKEAWNRYGQPMAITEVHIHCHREEQLRWFKYVYETGLKLTEEGVNIQAVTSWAMLGSYGWNQLLTQPGGLYEPGVFDLTGGSLRPTALATYIRQTAENKVCQHRLSEEKGWWQRESRLIYNSSNLTRQMNQSAAPVLIIGKNGTLGKAFARVCEERCIHYYLLGRNDCDISKPESIDRAISTYKPWAIINAAGYVRVDDAENASEDCMRDNATGPMNLAKACNHYGVQLVNFSSDLVFDGRKPTPYLESDLPNPLNIYGRSKAQSEIYIQKECPSALIIRTSAFFGPWDSYNFAYYVQKALSQYESITVARDIHISPTYIPHLVHTTLDILIDQESGIWHLANKGAMTWASFAEIIAERFHLDHSLIRKVNASSMNYAANRPFNSVLGSERGYHLPSFEFAMDAYMKTQKSENRKVA